jgi:hypothetical protein
VARPQLHLALTSHGFGHATRLLAWARELAAIRPELQLIVSTLIEESRVARELHGVPFEWRPVGYEPGAMQKNCFEVDLEATRGAYRRFVSERPHRLGAELEFLRDRRIDAVIADAPALAIRAAGDLGIPGIVVSSFTWDWILEEMVAGTSESWIPEALREDYRVSTRHLLLPLGARESPCPVLESAPLIARRATRSRAEVLARLGITALAEKLRLVLVCPGGWSASDWPTIEVRGCESFLLIFIGDLPIRTRGPHLHLPHWLPEGVEMPDLIAAADVVLTKPGYGIASECILARTALCGVERRDFREALLLVEDLRAAGPFSEISVKDFFAGRWEDPLLAAATSTVPWAEVADDGARRVAARIDELLALAWGPSPEPLSAKIKSPSSEGHP